MFNLTQPRYDTRKGHRVFLKEGQLASQPSMCDTTCDFSNALIHLYSEVDGKIVTDQTEKKTFESDLIV